MHKKLTALFVIAILIMSMGIVSAQDDLDSIDPTGVTITYWHEWDGQQQAGIDAVIALFEETNEYGITVEQVQLGAAGPILEQMSTGIVSGELPNLVGAAFVNNAQGWFLDGVLAPLDPYYNSETWGFSEEEIADLNQQLLDINRPADEPFNGQLLAWPIGASYNVLSVNMDMLSELGFDAPPATLEEFREVACGANELTTADGGDVQGFPMRISAFDMYSFIINQGGYIWDEETQMYNFTNEGAIRTLQFFQDLYNDGCAYIPDGTFVNTADFAFGLNPMAVGSSVGVPFIQGDIEASGSGIENWVNTTVPWTEGNRTLQASLRGIAMIENTPEENLATWLFIKFLASTEAQVIWTEFAQYQPYTFSALDGLSEEFLTANPQFSSVREALISGEIAIWSPPVNPAASDVSAAFDEMLVNITTGGQDVMEAAAAAETEANELLAEAMEDME